MKHAGTLGALAAAACIFAFATAAPAQAKPCCFNDGRYYEASSRTCYRYGGEVVPRRYCYRYGRDHYNDDGYYGRRGGGSFAIRIGDVWVGYSDGYYDRHRRWHRWRSHRDRDWFRRHHPHKYHHRRHHRRH
jgi:hypothetical protein